MQDQRLWELAKRRASFKLHLSVYLAILIFLGLVNYMTTNYPWFLWVALGWGIAVMLHFIEAYIWDPSAIEKEFLRLKAKQKRK